MFKNSKNHFEKFLILKTNFDSEQNVFSPYKSLQESGAQLKWFLSSKETRPKPDTEGGGSLSIAQC